MIRKNLCYFAGNVRNMMSSANIFHFVAYIKLYLEIIVYETPPGGRWGLQPAQGLDNYIYVWYGVPMFNIL